MKIKKITFALRYQTTKQTIMKRKHLLPAGITILALCTQITDPAWCLLFGLTSLLSVHLIIVGNESK